MQVPVQRATSLLHEELSHIAGPSATGPFIMQNCICNIYRVESSIRFLSLRKQCITHEESVRHNKHLYFWRCGPASIWYIGVHQQASRSFSHIFIIEENAIYRLLMMNITINIWVLSPLFQALFKTEHWQMCLNCFICNRGCHGLPHLLLINDRLYANSSSLFN